MDRSSCEAWEERDLSGVDLCETGHDMVHDSEQCTLCDSRSSLCRSQCAMIRVLLVALKPERLWSVSAGQAQLLDDHLVLPPPQELNINHGLSTCACHVKLGMTGFLKSTYVLYAAAALTPAVTRHVDLEFGTEHPHHLSICVAPTFDER